VRVVTVDRAGAESAYDVRVQTRAVHPHVAINEVYADPVGPEPDQEWVEIVNDGAAAVDTSGFVLDDGHAPTPLPSIVLDPGAFGLVVGSGFVTNDGVDPAPASGTPLLRVSRIGKGLSNTGTALTLRDASGAVLSRFPASPRPKTGVSVGRVAPAALDDDPSAFALDAVGGATPGAPNRSAP
jgi:hypothetical protein